MFHVYYVTWWIQRFDGRERYSGPHLWFQVPISQANAMDNAISLTMLGANRPYRRASANQFFFTVHTIEVPKLPAPAQPSPDDPSLEELS